jgi:hypothetical protein
MHGQGTPQAWELSAKPLMEWKAGSGYMGFSTARKSGVKSRTVKGRAAESPEGSLGQSK